MLVSIWVTLFNLPLIVANVITLALSIYILISKIIFK